MAAEDELLSVVFVGHVDHGKSTVIGRMLHDADALPEGKIEMVRERCRRNSKPFEYAFLLDALIEEQEQGITIDSARVFFKTEKRKYLIIDTPGHIEFLKNMVTGASHADAAMLIIDANEGVQENSKRHGYLLSMLGINQIAVIINKMDLVGYSKEKFDEISEEFTNFLNEIDVHPVAIIPASGREGDNIVNRTENLSWYKGKTVLEQLESFNPPVPMEDLPFRMFVQGVYKFTAHHDNRRIVAGTVNTGKLSVGDEVIFFPSGKKSRVRSLECFACDPPKTITAGYAIGFTLTEQIYVRRGQLAVLTNEKPPNITSRILTNIFWLGKNPLMKDMTVFVKLGTQKQPARLERIDYVLDASTLQKTEKEMIERNEVARCVFKLKEPIAFDLSHEIQETSRFVIVDDYRIKGGGIIIKALEDSLQFQRQKVILRDYKWESSKIGIHERAERYSQKPTLLILTGVKDNGKKDIAKALEQKLFNLGRFVYYLGIGSVLYGVDADIKVPNQFNHKDEHMRRLGEVSNILLDAGIILILTATELTNQDLEIIKTSIRAGEIIVVWVGDNITTNVDIDYQLQYNGEIGDALRELMDLLRKRGIIYDPEF